MPYDLHQLNRDATLSGVYPDGRRAVVFPDGLTVWVHVDAASAALVVSVDHGRQDPGSPTIRQDDPDDESLRVRIDLAGFVLYDDTDEARAAGTVVNPWQDADG